jgi:hypothetical protein
MVEDLRRYTTEAASDGYMFLTVRAAHAANQMFYIGKLPYDAVKSFGQRNPATCQGQAVALPKNPRFGVGMAKPHSSFEHGPAICG